MANTRLVSDSFYTTFPQWTIIFEEGTLATIQNMAFHDEIVLDKNLIVPIPQPRGGESQNNDDTTLQQLSSLIKDVHRDVSCNLHLYHTWHPEEKKAEGENIEKIRNFIKKSLGIGDAELEKLESYYSQTLEGFLSGTIAQSLTPTSDYTLLPEVSGSLSNLYKDSDGKIRLEVTLKDTKLKDISNVSNVKDAGIIPGKLAYQFVLTDKGFKLEKFAASNQLLFDLTTLNIVDNFDKKLAVLREENKSFFARNWRFFAFGLGVAALTALLITLGIVTFGVGPAIIAGVTAVVGAAVLTEAAALVIGAVSLVIGAVAAYAGLFGAAVGIAKIHDALSTSSTKQMLEKSLAPNKSEGAKRIMLEDEEQSKSDHDTTTTTSTLEPDDKTPPSKTPDAKNASGLQDTQQSGPSRKPSK